MRPTTPARSSTRASKQRPRRWLSSLAVLVALAAPAYILWTTVLGLSWEGYNEIRDTQSELGAVDSPVRHLMNVGGFMALGVAILGFAVLYVLSLSRGRVTGLATGLLVIAGVGMIVVGFFPCDAGCIDVTETGRLHGRFSAPGAIGLPAAAMLSAYVFMSDGRFSPRFGRWSFWVGLLALASGPVIAAGLLEDANGLLQRAGIWPPLLWMSLVAYRLRDPESPNATEPG